MRILMTADGSQYGTKDLLTACRILSPPGSQVKHEFELVTVAPKAPPIKHTASAGIQHRLNNRARRLAEAVQKQLAGEGVNAKTMVHTGSPTGVLIRCAQGYDAVVIGATSHGDASYPGLGPVASRLVEHAATTVLLARAGTEDSTIKILVPTDGSDAGLEALDKLGELRDLSASEITLMHVVETPWLRPVDDQEWIEQETLEEGEADALAVQQDMEREFTEEGEGVLDQARNRLPGSASVETIIKHGVPADEIISEAETGNYDLVVLAATGQQRFEASHIGQRFEQSRLERAVLGFVGARR